MQVCRWVWMVVRFVCVICVSACALVCPLCVPAPPGVFLPRCLFTPVRCLDSFHRQSFHFDTEDTGLSQAKFSFRHRGHRHRTGVHTGHSDTRESGHTLPPVSFYRRTHRCKFNTARGPLSQAKNISTPRTPFTGTGSLWWRLDSVLRYLGHHSGYRL